MSAGSDSEESQGGAVLSSRGSAIVDERTNSLLITDTAAVLDRVRSVITLLDIPVRQVMIEARIVVATADVSEEAGYFLGRGFIDDSAVDGGDAAISIRFRKFDNTDRDK